MKKIIPALVLSTLLLVPVLAFAQMSRPPLVMSTFQELIDTINRAGGWIFSILLVLAVVIVVWGAAELTLSGGDPQAVSSGKGKIIYGIIGLVVAALAAGIVAIVRAFFNF